MLTPKPARLEGAKVRPMELFSYSNCVPKSLWKTSAIASCAPCWVAISDGGINRTFTPEAFRTAFPGEAGHVGREARRGLHSGTARHHSSDLRMHSANNRAGSARSEARGKPFYLQSVGPLPSIDYAKFAA